MWKTLNRFSQSILPVFASKQMTRSPSVGCDVVVAADDVQPAVEDQRRGPAAERLLPDQVAVLAGGVGVERRRAGPVSRETPFCSGPRQWTQSAAERLTAEAQRTQRRQQTRERGMERLMGHRRSPRLRSAFSACLAVYSYWTTRRAFISNRGRVPGGTAPPRRGTAVRRGRPGRPPRRAARRRRRRPARPRSAGRPAGRSGRSRRGTRPPPGTGGRPPRARSGTGCCPRTWIISSARPEDATGQPQPRPAARASGPGRDPHQVAGAVADQRAADAAEVRHAPVRRPRRRGRAVAVRVEHLGEVLRLQRRSIAPGSASHSIATGPTSVMP